MATISPPAAHVAAASLNQTVGDWSGNRDRIIRVLAKAKARGVKLICFPEMCIPGYSLGDRLLRRGTLDRSWRVLEELAEHTTGMIACLGLPIRHRGVVYNAVAVVADGKIVGLACKEHLATGDVQYENRWYHPWPHGQVDEFITADNERVPIGTLLFQGQGIGRFALEICEDGWKGIRPGSIYALAGAEILLNPSASWFVIGKHRVRRAMVEQLSREDHCAYLYTSLLGCDSTRLVFDGSVFIGLDGEIASEGKRFLFDTDHELVDRVVDLDQLRLQRMEEGSWREQVQSFTQGQYGPAPGLVELEGDYSCAGTPPAAGPYWEHKPQRHLDPSLAWLENSGLVPTITPPDLPHLELELALCMGMRDYVEKSGIRSLALALSGGKDSAMVALLVHRMFRYHKPDLSQSELLEYIQQRFLTAYLATENSGSVTENAAANLALALGAKHHISRMQGAVDEHVKLVGQMVGSEISWDNPKHDIPLQNVQARLRGSMIWMLANLNGSLLLTTSNKSEAAVGYTTMDGDTSGGISPIADVPKSLVVLYLYWARRFHDIAALDGVNVQAATAELRPPGEEQTDEGDLMPFKILDRLMYQFVQVGQDPLEIFQALWPELQAHYGAQNAKAFATDIRRFVTLFCRAQWKRERFAISFRVTAFDLDPKTGFRFPPVQAPFTEELAELDAHITALEQA